jgi:hypothetical protein
MQEFVGKVTKKPFGRASQSEHDAVYLETADRSYVLPRPGGNPFHDLQLEKLVGKTIRCRGEASNYTLIMADCTVVDE